MGGGPFSFGGGDTSASQSQQTGGDGTRNTRGNKNTSAEPYSVAIGSDSKLNFGLDLSKAKIGKNGTLVIGDGGAQVANLSKGFLSTITGLFQSNNAALAGLSQQSSDAQAHSLDKIVGLATSVQTGGESTRSKLILQGALWLGLFGAVALIAYFISKRH